MKYLGGLYYKFLFILLLIFQLIDGLLTAHGITIAATLEVEGNPLVKYFMYYYGPYLGLFLVKIAACIMIGFMYIIIQRARRVTLVMKIGLNIALYSYLYTICLWVYLIWSKKL